MGQEYSYPRNVIRVHLPHHVTNDPQHEKKKHAPCGCHTLVSDHDESGKYQWRISVQRSYLRVVVDGITQQGSFASVQNNPEVIQRSNHDEFQPHVILLPSEPCEKTISE